MENELRRKRKELGITQEHAAKLAGVSRRTYQTYEENYIDNETNQMLMSLMEELSNGYNVILSIKAIKTITRRVLMNYKEVKAAYLFGSYARGEATGKSDVDILLVSEPMGMKLFGIGPEIEELLHKPIDIHTHRQLINNEVLLEEVLKEGIKIYG